MEITVCNNCDELIAHLIFSNHTSQYCCGGHIEFEGDLCEVEGTIPDHNGLFLMSPKYPTTLFIIGGPIETDSCQQIIHFWVIQAEGFYLDQSLCVTLPAEIYSELIATIKGEW